MACKPDFKTCVKLEVRETQNHASKISSSSNKILTCIKQSLRADGLLLRFPKGIKSLLSSIEGYKMICIMPTSSECGCDGMKGNAQLSYLGE
jgi:hypothetical protein